VPDRLYDVLPLRSIEQLLLGSKLCAISTMYGSSHPHPKAG
jgi:hypothetical protein